MINLSSPRASQLAGHGQHTRNAWWLSVLLMLLLSWPEAAQASHIRAGDIQSKVDTTIGPGFNARRIFFRLTLYTDRTNTEVKEDSAHIYFGDGSCAVIPRNSRYGGPLVGPTRIGTTETDINYYYFEHFFFSNGPFTISYIGENRNRGVRNMDNSADRSFYVSTFITIDPALGRNRSAVLNAPAIDQAGVLQVFLHNPAASDADGDSLSFQLRECQEVPRGVLGVDKCEPTPRIVAGWRYPQARNSSPAGRQVPYNGDPPGVNSPNPIFVQNVRTGQITWNAPGDPGIYNIAFVVKEYRRTPDGPRLIGEVIRDMQIIVRATNNLRPAIRVPNDTCVIAGATVVGNVTATDATAAGSDPATPVVLSAFGGILPPATFRQSTQGPPVARGRFEWKTECNNVANLPYQVLFKAEDTPGNGSGSPVLTDERVWRITVVGPPPQNLQAAAGPPVTNGGTALVTWDRYTCARPAGTPADQQVRMLIFRKEGPANFTPDACQTGIPTGLGYTQIGDVSADLTSFRDDDAGAGLRRGKTYCYRIYAVFPLPAGGASIASQEACLTIDGREALFTNVDVTRTSTTEGEIFVRWTKPVAPSSLVGGYKAPLGYRLLRAEGINPAAANFQEVYTTTNLLDTVRVDTRLDTQGKQYTYKLEFRYEVGGRQTIETSPTASSVRVTATAQSLQRRIVVSWTYQVPWDNTKGPTRIFRRKQGDVAFVEITTVPGSATGGTYTDADPTLLQEQTYCYYVQTEGRYADIPFLQTLLNKSQEQCVLLSSEPCAPVLRVLPLNCDSLAANVTTPYPAPNQRYENNLRWTTGNTPAGCLSTNIKYFRIFSGTSRETLVLRDSTTGLEYRYADRNLPDNARCYAVQSVDATGRRSQLSNVECVDNCLFFVLPNIFTPNGDQYNNTFRPKLSSPVRKVRFQVFNRWGVKMYEGDRDPLINWDGGGAQGEGGASNKVADGIYYYLAEVEFADFASTKRVYKGWVQIVR